MNGTRAKRIGQQAWLIAVALLLLGSGGLPAASKQFGDLEIRTMRIVNEPTRHGYFEHRFTVVNNSEGDDYTVTISLPVQRGGSGMESISSISRTVKVNAKSRLTFPILQPALPLLGRNLAAVEINGRSAGAIEMSGHFTHGNFGHGAAAQRTVLVSRTINETDLENAVKRRTMTGFAGMDFGSDQATGRPNVPTGRSGYHQRAWLPAPSSAGSQWLEVEFLPPMKADTLRVVKCGPHDALRQVKLMDDSGVQIRTITNTNLSRTTRSRYHNFDISLGTVTQAVKRVRIEFDTYRRSTIGVDAVALRRGSASRYADSAQASSTYAMTTFSSSSRHRSADHPTIMKAEWEIADWSDNWLAYTAFDMVAVHSTDFGVMPMAVKEALWRYTEAGGTLAVFGKAEIPKPWNDRVISNRGRVSRYSVGFGECLELDAADAGNLGSEQLNQIGRSSRLTAAVWDGFGNAAAANGAFPVVENLSVPVGGITIIMLLFILAVGPANIFLLARKNRRIWMLWTVPAISLATCGVVFVYSLFSEGITPRLRMESVTLLDHSSRRATTLGRLAFYCPLTPSGGLNFNYESEVFPIVERGYGGRGTSKTINWSQGQHFQSGWLQARMPAHFAVRKSESRRERVQFEKQADGSWAAVNGLGSTIESLAFKDEDGMIWRTQGLDAGSKAIMSVDSKTAENPNQEIFRNMYQHGNWVRQLAQSFKLKDLPPGWYYAELEAAPFMESGLKARAKSTLGSVVFGILSPEELTQ